ncbi:putative threonine-phosphate decarboxylase [Smittium culicis]|uniref:Putative threonine-phosphate decarboxylase n=1 Tax=Smittium culicis TaxID=133412 RepID=A0A1R1YBF3_9FUNG|nr:putative threonine-phosphate decarboxylase [Smittium culicis]OMJ28480.1 putative threonine-phosphate decarboxylase [Smittium culicis]
MAETKNVQVWDQKVQQFHGGQEWKFVNNFIDDFSVTTNALGTPKDALKAATDAVAECGHYPPANQEPAKSRLASFLWPSADPQSDCSNIPYPDADYYGKNNLILGNGASELIDLVMRLAKLTSPETCNYFKPGPVAAQYKEYERAAKNCGLQVIAPNSSNRHQKANVVSLVNPCNPTGDFLSKDQVLDYIFDSADTAGDTFAIVDESMLPWHGPDFRACSLATDLHALADISRTRRIHIFVIHSWTKLWCCTGLRLGSIVGCTPGHTSSLLKYQVPWSVNSMALAFLATVVANSEYLAETWACTPKWRKIQVDALKSRFPTWSFHGEPFLSWIWIDTHDISVADSACQVARSHGVPIRSGKPGYMMPSFIRIAVRNPDTFKVLFNAFDKNLD